MEDLSGARLPALLDLLEQPGSPAAAGSAAALVAAAAAALVAKVARASAGDWADGAPAAAQAAALRARVLPLAQLDAQAYEAAVARLAGRGELPQEVGDFELGRALGQAADVLLRIAEAAADVAQLGALVAGDAHPDGKPDAAAAVMLAEASARAAAHLVEVNLAVAEGDERAGQARAAVAAAAAALEQACGIKRA